MKAAWDTDNKIDKIAREANSDFLGSDLSYLMGDMCTILEKVLNSDNEDISYFCTCTDFGRDWKPGIITDTEGNDIDLSSAEKLYNYLTCNKSG